MTSEKDMVESFPKILSGLRKEKKISQKEAAASLGISQALLSHYENGLREPGLEFAVNAAAYYGVSTDYLFGVSDKREVPSAENKAPSHAREPLSQTPKRLAVNSVSLLYDAVGRTGSSALSEALSEAVSQTLYKLLRLFSKGAEDLPAPFKLKEGEAERLCDAGREISEGKLREMLKDIAPVIDGHAVREDHPVYEHSLLATVKLAEEKLLKLKEL